MTQGAAAAALSGELTKRAAHLLGENKQSASAGVTCALLNVADVPCPGCGVCGRWVDDRG